MEDFVSEISGRYGIAGEAVGELLSLAVSNAMLRIFERHSFVFEENILSLWDCDDGRERYLSILRRHPQLLRDVPLKKLASYLKVTPQSLSRIRAGITSAEALSPLTGR